MEHERRKKDDVSNGTDVGGIMMTVLDHGYVMVVDTMGDDDRIVQAARVSYASNAVNQKPKDEAADEKLLRFMMRNRHTSPFEQCCITLEVKLPIFVERQWARHRTASWNEVSGRYSVLPEEFYIPEPDAVRRQSVVNRQGREEEMDPHDVAEFRELLERSCREAYRQYRRFLDLGVARELARCVLPVNIYTSKVWTINLHNLMHFLELRMDEHAQWEIRQYANAIAGFVSGWVPQTWNAFKDYRLDGCTLSAGEQVDLGAALPCGEMLEIKCLDGREEQELMVKVNRMQEIVRPGRGGARNTAT